MSSALASVACMAVGSHCYKSSIYAPVVSEAGPHGPPPPVGGFLLMESGNYLLLETGNKIILE